MGLRYILLLVAIVMVALIARSLLASRKAAAKPLEQAGEDMLRCAHCGIHVPRQDALIRGDKAWCCPEHLAADE